VRLATRALVAALAVGAALASSLPCALGGALVRTLAPWS
jgi:hypothetical protein